MSALRFRSLHLRNWKNFKSVDVDLADRVFILGPNAVGKSNLLLAFRFLRDVAADVGGGLAAAVRAAGGVKSIRSLHARSSRVTIDVEIGNDAGAVWRYLLEFSATDRAGHSSPYVLRETVCWNDLEGNPQREEQTGPDKRRDSEQLEQTLLEQSLANARFRPLLEFLRSTSYLHVVPQLVREGQSPREASIGPDPFGRDLLRRMWQTPERERTRRLGEIQRELLAVVPQFRELAIEPDDDGRPHLKVGFLHWRKPLAGQTEHQFSDGTLRLIGLLWSLQERSGPLLLEEPELSLHAEIVRRLPGAIARAQRRGGGRQVLLSTHSEAILQDPGIGAEEVLLVCATKEGSEAIVGATDARIRKAMSSGLTAAEAAMPRAAPNSPEQGLLFGHAG